MSIEKLKEKYDKVLIKHNKEGPLKGTEVVLVKGLNIYMGSSLLHENDAFDRKRGRTIAVGRAEFARKVSNGEKESRDKRVGSPESFTIKCKDAADLEARITAFYGDNS